MRTYGTYLSNFKWYFRKRYKFIDDLGKRYTIFRSVLSHKNFLQPTFYLISGAHIRHSSLIRSNYGVWLNKREGDITYERCLRADYINGLEAILRGIRSETTFIDIGANIGVFSLIAEKNPKITSILAFEPSHESYSFMKLNIIGNSATKVTAFPYAIGPKSGSMPLSIHNGHSGRSRVGEAATGKVEMIQMMNSDKLESVLSDIRNPVFLKIDVEGYEIEVIKTLMKTSKFSYVRKIHLEFDTKLGDVKGVEELLRSGNFDEQERWGDSHHWDAFWVRVDSIN